MSRNGSGVYSLPPGSTVLNGDTSDATDVNTPLADIATDLNTARPIVAGGTGATSVAAAQAAFKIPAFDGTATISGSWTFTAAQTFNDSVVLGFGTGDDLQIYHNGTNGFVSEMSGGALVIEAVSMTLRSQTGGDTYFFAQENGAAAVYHDGNVKVATTSTGINVTGAVDADTIAGDMIASQVEAEAGTATDKVMNPLRTAQAIAALAGSFDTLAFGYIENTATTPAFEFQTGFNATITDNGTGDYTLTFDSAEPDTEYSVILTATTRNRNINLVTRATGSFDVVTTDSATNASADADFSVIVIRSL